ncbi:MAG: hypothetical protein J6Y97_11600 [Prevotella sp.]|nr:hypothetical protein [Prevotella sp.]
MRKRLVFVFLLCCLSALSVEAQDAKKAIRDHYAAIKEMLDLYAQLEADGEEYPVNECYKVKIIQNLPGTGRHEEDVSLYYGEVEGSDEIYPDHWLEFVSSSYNYAATKYYREFLFDNKGNITFIYGLDYSVDDNKEYEFRFYFNKGKLFDVLVKSRKEGEKDFSQEYTGKTLPAKYHSFYQQYADDIAKYGRLFEAIDGAAHH